MWGHPGKKLLFMGQEFAQGAEWNHDHSLDWHLTGHPLHRGVQLLVRDLNRLQRELPALHAMDCEPAGFAWIDANDGDNSTYAWLRMAGEDEHPVAVVSNMTPVPREGFRLGLPREGFWAERLNTDAETYGGANLGNAGGVRAIPVAAHGQPFSAMMTLPPLATVFLEWVGA